MKKLFAGLLVGTMVMVGTGTVFAATEGKTDNLTAKLVKSEAASQAKDVDMTNIEYTVVATTVESSAAVQKAENKEGLMITASIEAIELTPAQKVEMEKEQQAFEARLKEVCQEAGYDYETIITKLENGTLTDEELQVFNEAGLIFAVAAQPAEMIQIEDTQEIIQMTKIIEK